MSTLNNGLGPSLTLAAQGAGSLTAPAPHGRIPDVHYRGVIVIVTITAITAGDTVSIVGYDPTPPDERAANSGRPDDPHYLPGIPPVANVAANSPVPNYNNWTVQAVVATGPVSAFCSSLYCY